MSFSVNESLFIANESRGRNLILIIRMKEELAWRKPDLLIKEELALIHALLKNQTSHLTRGAGL